MQMEIQIMSNDFAFSSVLIHISPQFQILQMHSLHYRKIRGLLSFFLNLLF